MLQFHDGGGKAIRTTLAVLFLAAIILALIVRWSRDEGVTITFLDVGQGDAILVRSGNNDLLIDGGPSGTRTLEGLGRAIPFWDRTIETVIVTHPDQDHIGGLPDVAAAYEIKTVISTNQESESQIYKAWMDALDAEGAVRVDAALATGIVLGKNVRAEVIYPDDQTFSGSGSSNDSSVVLKIIYGRNQFLLTGDVSGSAEKKLIGRVADSENTILKVAHHGSKSSTGEDFLKSVPLRQAIISAGLKNRYGHPHPDVLERLRERGITVWRTDEHGSVTYRCHDPQKDCEVAVENF